MTTTAAPPEVADAFEAALAADARATAATAAPEVPPPPPRATSTDPEAPHGRDDDGQPLAPFGMNKKTGRPNLKPGGPGRGHKQDRPRETTPDRAPATPATTGPAGKRAPPPDYSADLAGLGMSVWMGASAVQGGRLPLLGLPLPDLRPYAYVWQEQLPQLVGAWNTAAQQSPTVRGWVEKLAGEGSWQWVIGVSVTSAHFLAACTELARKDEPGQTERAKLRADYAAANDAQVRAFLAQQLGGAAEQLGGQAAAGAPA